MLFRVFTEVLGREWEMVFWLLKFQIFWGCLTFLIFFGGER